MLKTSLSKYELTHEFAEQQPFVDLLTFAPNEVMMVPFTSSVKILGLTLHESCDLVGFGQLVQGAE